MILAAKPGICRVLWFYKIPFWEKIPNLGIIYTNVTNMKNIRNP